MYYTNIIKSISARGLFTLLALIISISLHAQNATVKGVIVDETDTPLIGATVQVKGTATGSITDFDGNYTIKANKGAVITFSYIGYKTQEIKFTGQSPLNVKMIPDNQTLDEVVVVGYGTMKRSDLTGSVASIAAKDVEGFKTSSVAGALGGQIAGVQITSTDGTPGAGFSINIRGVGTLTGDSSPLYIVDGFEVDDIDYLSNSDIESIEVLKDASSSAIYGARAANGVVLITTKSGKTGRPLIQNIQTPTSSREMTIMIFPTVISHLMTIWVLKVLTGRMKHSILPGHKTIVCQSWEVQMILNTTHHSHAILKTVFSRTVVSIKLQESFALTKS